MEQEKSPAMEQDVDNGCARERKQPVREEQLVEEEQPKTKV
jgi:hypothetical protein